jgi:hypothetical protein
MTHPDYRALCEEMLICMDQDAALVALRKTANNEPADGPWRQTIRERARAELAQPEPAAPTDEEWDALWDKEAEYFALYGEARRFARAAYSIGRQHGTTLTPIPVSDRPWEHEGFCDAEGFAWFWSPEDQCWFWERHNSNFIMRYGEEFSCLPANALPLPAAPEEGE